MPKQLWHCEVCKHTEPGWTEADAAKCEQSHLEILRVISRTYQHPGDYYPQRVWVMFSDGSGVEYEAVYEDE